MAAICGIYGRETTEDIAVRKAEFHYLQRLIGAKTIAN